MANTSVVYARIDSELKEIVLKKGIPFELCLPSTEPTTIGGMTREQIDIEQQKGMDDIAAGRVISADEVAQK